MIILLCIYKESILDVISGSEMMMGYLHAIEKSSMGSRHKPPDLADEVIRAVSKNAEGQRLLNSLDKIVQSNRSAQITRESSLSDSIYNKEGQVVARKENKYDFTI